MPLRGGTALPLSGRRILVGALAALALALATPAHAQSRRVPTPGGFVLSRNEGLQAELRRPASRARSRRLRRMLEEVLDYGHITRRALVVYWDNLSVPQRREAEQLLTRAIRVRYLQNVEALAGYEVRVQSERPRGPGFRVVTEATQGRERRQIEYDLVRHGSRYRIVDLIVDSDSLIHMYRQQFNRVIRREGFDGFIRRLEEVVRRDEAGDGGD